MTVRTDQNSLGTGLVIGGHRWIASVVLGVHPRIELLADGFTPLAAFRSEERLSNRPSVLDELVNNDGKYVHLYAMQ